jgi:hypothetical protein
MVTHGNLTTRSYVATGIDAAPVTYDNINLQRGTTRIIASTGASDLSASWRSNSIWLVEKAPAGNLILTTIFAAHLKGSQEFVVIESRHSGFI